MSHFEHTPNNEYVAARVAAVRARVRTAKPADSRVESAIQRMMSWIDATRRGHTATDDTQGSSISQMLPPTAKTMRKPWVVSQLPA
jgi:hypothetical protein